jgi:hypothetical protein
MKPRTVISIEPPLSNADRRDLSKAVRRINGGQSAFTGNRFMFRGSTVVLSPAEPDKAGADKPKGRSKVGTGRP